MNETDLRDLFAGLVAAGLASSDHFNPNGAVSRRNLAGQAYELADELLKVRASVQNSSTREGGIE